jgi:hypothetical protein
VKEAVCSQKTPASVEASSPALRLREDYGALLETVEHSEPDKRHKVDVVLEEAETLARRLAYGLLLLGEVGQEWTKT